MNRARRRKQLRNLFDYQAPIIPMPKTVSPKLSASQEPDFSDVPLATVCQSIGLLINELRSRGYPVYDFDHKEKTVQGIKIIRNKVYFLVAEEAGNGRSKEGNEENRK